MILLIKNMICLSCRMVVKYELEKLNVVCISVEAGRVETLGPIPAEKMAAFKIALLNAGLELMDGKKNLLVEKIQNVIADMIDYADCAIKIKFSAYLSVKLKRDYTYLANVFSEIQGITIERYIIMQKILRVKQLICAENLNLTEISWKMHYSSVGHLSSQFKKVTGVTPSKFKQSDCNSLLAA